MFGYNQHHGGGNNRSRDRPSPAFGGHRGGRGNSSSWDNRRPPYAQRDPGYDSSRSDRGFGSSRGSSRRYDDRRGGSSGRYSSRQKEWDQHEDRGRGGHYGGERSHSYRPGGRGGGGNYYSNGREGPAYSRHQQGGRSSDNQYSRGRGRRPRSYDHNWEKAKPNQNGRPGNWGIPNGLDWMVNIRGHRKKITSVAFDEGTGRLFTGSEDSTVRVWSASTGQCEHTVTYEGEVQVLLLTSGYLFVGLRNYAPTPDGMVGEVVVYDLDKNTEDHLSAHSGRVLCLHAVNGFLFTGGEDKVVKAWRFQPNTSKMEEAGTLGMEQGGHPASVKCLASLPNFLFSGDIGGNIRVWNLESGTLSQKLENAHSQAITSMVVWKEYLITGSLDGNLHVWKHNKSAFDGVGLALDAEPFYTLPGRGNNGPPPAILSCCGALDGEGNSILMVSSTTHEVVLYSLPEFEVKGSLPEIDEARALSYARGGYVFIGDVHGEVKVFNWRGSFSESDDLHMES